MRNRTRNNLKIAMERDALDAAKYHGFAARARNESEWRLAKLFEQTAELDRTEHFRREAELHGSTTSSSENLRRAISEQKAEAEQFVQFAKEAAEDGDQAAADLFESLSHEKGQSVRKFEDALARMGIHSDSDTRTSPPVCN